MKYLPPRFWPMILVLAFGLAFNGCVTKKEAASAEVTSYSSGSLALPGKTAVDKTIYVEFDDTSAGWRALARSLETTLAHSGFIPVSSPSKAANILHVAVLHAGKVNESTLKSLVKAGYGTEANFTGTGASAMLADVLLVRRKVPEASRPSRARLKNISTRNAVDSRQMRLGILVQGQPPEDPASFFGKRLVAELVSAMATGTSAAAAEAQK